MIDETQENTANESNTIPVDNSGLSTFLSQFKGDSSTKISTHDIYKPRQKEYSETGDNNYYDYYPAMKEPIQTGTYSGSMVGSNPIYSTAALFPYGLIDNRQNALARAAEQKAAEQSAFAAKFNSLSAPVTKHAAVNPDIQNLFHKGIADLPKKFTNDSGNVDYKALMQSGEPQKYAERVNAVAKMEDYGQNLIAEYDHDVSEGKRVRTPYMDDLREKFMNGTYSTMMMNSDPDKAKQAMEILQLKGGADADKLADEISKHIEPDETSGLSGISHQGMYDILTTTDTKSLKSKPAQQRLADATQASYKNAFSGRPDAIPYNEFAKMVAARIGSSAKTKVQTVSTKGNEHDYQMTEKDLNHAETDINSELPSHKFIGVKDAEGNWSAVPTGETKKTSFQIQNYFPMPAGAKPFTWAASKDAKDVQGGLATNGELVGDKKVSPAGVGVIYTMHLKGSQDDGRTIGEKDIDATLKRGATITAEPVAILSVYEKDKGGKDFIAGTVTTNIDNVSNGISEKDKEGKYKSGINVDLLKQKAQEANDKINNMNDPIYEFNGFTEKKSEWIKQGWTQKDLDKNAKKK